MDIPSYIATGSDIVSIFGTMAAFFALWIAWKQLIPIRESIETLSKADKRAKELQQELSKNYPKKLTRIYGFDPRFSSLDWRRLLDSSANKKITIGLSKTYKEFTSQLIQAPRTLGRSLLIVDLVSVPEYIERGIIKPIDDVPSIDFDNLLETYVHLHDTEYDRLLSNIFRMLCSDATQTGIGVLPLWVNWQGRYLSEPSRNAFTPPLWSEVSLDAIFERNDAQLCLRDSAVQMSGISSAVFEFWGHLAYRGLTLFETDPYNKSITCAFRTDPEKSRREFNHALADFITRIRFCRSLEQNFFRATCPNDFWVDPSFEFDQVDDARSARDGNLSWKPIFSSELLTKSLPRAVRSKPAECLANEHFFFPPFSRRLANGAWTYLSALGGYGLAIPATAEVDSDLVKSIKYLFLTNPRIFHPYLHDALEDIDDIDATREFAKKHVRPRWPFWNQAEKLMINCITEHFLIVNKTLEVVPSKFWEKTYRLLELNPKALESKKQLVDKLNKLALKNGWSVAR